MQKSSSSLSLSLSLSPARVKLLSLVCCCLIVVYLFDPREGKVENVKNTRKMAHKKRRKALKAAGIGDSSLLVVFVLLFE